MSLNLNSLNLNSQQFATIHPYADKMVDSRDRHAMSMWHVRHEIARCDRCKRAQEQAIRNGNKIIRSN